MPRHDQASRATTCAGETGACFGAVLSCVLNSAAPTNGKPPARLPATVGIAFHDR